MILTSLIPRLLATRPFLINMSCLMGFFTWYILSESRSITRTLALPLYVNNLPEQAQLTAPETIDITLCTTRSLMHKAIAHGAVAVDQDQLKKGKQLLSLTRENLLLPTAVKVINYNPVEITLT